MLVMNMVHVMHVVKVMSGIHVMHVMNMVDVMNGMNWIAGGPIWMCMGVCTLVYIIIIIIWSPLCKAGSE